MSQPCPHLGLIISVTRHASTAEHEADELRNDLLAVLEANDLIAGPGLGLAREYVVSRQGGQVTDLDRSRLLEWSARWEHLATIGVSAVTDLDDDP